jgi:hypothetical protein
MTNPMDIKQCLTCGMIFKGKNSRQKYCLNPCISDAMKQIRKSNAEKWTDKKPFLIDGLTAGQREYRNKGNKFRDLKFGSGANKNMGMK